MDAAGPLLGLMSAPSALAWLWSGPAGRYAVPALVALALAVAFACGALYMRRRQRFRYAKAAKPADATSVLKERLRRRLAEPVDSFAPFAAAGPTIGAGEVAEGDLDAAAKEVLPEAGWRRGAAKHVLRQRLKSSHGGGANGSEKARWRQLGALALIDDAHDALAAYSRAADLAPDDTDLQLLLGVLYLRTGRLQVAEATFRRQLERATDKGDTEVVANGEIPAEAAAQGGDQTEAVANGKTDTVAASQPDAEAASNSNGGPGADITGTSNGKAAASGKNGAGDVNRCATKYRAGTMLGDVLLAKGEREAALAAYQAARKDVLALIAREPDNPRWRRGASLAHDRVGDFLLADGQHEPALECFRQSLQICEWLAKGDPANADRQHDLSVAHDRVGEVLASQGDLDGALESYRQGLALAEAAAQLAPACTDWHWDVSASHDRIGDMLSAKGEASDAVASYRLGLAIAEALAADDPARLDWQRDLAVTCHKLGLLEAQLGREAEAREALEQGRAIVARLAEVARYQVQWRADLARFNAALKSLGP
jgi:tetratricopeptide (TPR) repeat protein